MNPIKKSQLFFSFFTLPILMFFLFSGVAGCSEKKTSVLAPDFEINDLNGKKFKLSDFKGQVVFLDFWATWCPPCVMSIPSVGKLADDYQGKPVNVISLSVDQDESAVRAFVADHKMKNRVIFVGGSGIDLKYGVQGIPAFYVINKKGEVTNGWPGFNSMMPQIWRKEINRVLQEP